MKTILIQLDTDPHPSAFDRVVAVDAGVDHLFSYGGVTAKNVQNLIHGAMFTRGPKDLHHTAVFIGGSDVTAGEYVLDKVRDTFFGPLSVSVMLDANGANTTAAAAVRAAAQHVDLESAQAVVLGGTGPVGQRACRLLARQGAKVRLSSRDQTRAGTTAANINAEIGSRNIEPVTGLNLEGAQIVIAAGAAGIRMLDEADRKQAGDLKVVIDLNAVPPAGIEGIEPADKARDDDGQILYGPIGVGGTKMKIHKAAINKLFESNDQVLDAEAIYDLACALS